MLRHIKLHAKLRQLAAQSLLNVGKAASGIMASVIKRSPTPNVPVQLTSEAPPAKSPPKLQRLGTSQRLHLLQRQGSKFVSTMAHTIAETALSGGEEYLRYIEASGHGQGIQLKPSPFAESSPSKID